jgi:hypothetical protein
VNCGDNIMSIENGVPAGGEWMRTIDTPEVLDGEI